MAGNTNLAAIKLAVALEKNKALESENEYLRKILNTKGNLGNDYGNEDELRKIRKALKAARGEIESLRALHDTFLENSFHMKELDIIKYMAEYKRILLQSESSSPCQLKQEEEKGWISSSQRDRNLDSETLNSPPAVHSPSNTMNGTNGSPQGHKYSRTNIDHARQSKIRQNEVELRKRTSADGCVEFDF
ncbi:hypothetical protein GUITHDRAFT_119891 [Guillardia theta CCMP2712]|uniref:Uncharacterized protein n=1 Tax=Guillardia theta (strain CCMP2712) TaxID=905079 RepID=L1ICF6_GUITC|nr:hypothetical protein GUITHDRAFT_119891 [Guillardia theta CCMP2712]EKX33908.1 hypothetical protein GUITHDRAFT_119891 [Guillardia theta CCMP2712]|eukprot:XP_005820888.1 hypothetical protein GUITHDRAFT_119891 [Guillardia theta CCMP2712]